MDALGGGADACAGDDDHLKRLTVERRSLKLAFISSKPGGMLFSNVLEYSIWTPEWFYALSVEYGKKNNVME